MPPDASNGPCGTRQAFQEPHLFLSNESQFTVTRFPTSYIATVKLCQIQCGADVACTAVEELLVFARVFVSTCARLSDA